MYIVINAKTGSRKNAQPARHLIDSNTELTEVSEYFELSRI